MKIKIPPKLCSYIQFGQMDIYVFSNSKPSPNKLRKIFKCETEIKPKIPQQKKFPANNGIEIKVNVGCGIHQNYNKLY